MLLGIGLVLGVGWLTPASAAYSTQAAPSWVPNGTVKAMARSGNVIYIAGSFTVLTQPGTTNRATRNRVAAIDVATGALLPWNPDANGLVDAIAVSPDGKKVYLGGDFTTVGGTTATRLGAVEGCTADSCTGARAPGWSATANASVHDLYVDVNGSVYAGGRFGALNGKTRRGVGRLDGGSGALVTEFNAAVTGGRVLTLEPAPDGTLLVGGSFTAVGGQTRSFAAGVSKVTGAVTPWSPGAQCGTCYLWDLTATSNAVYAAIGGPGGRVVRWDPTTGAVRWSKSADGNVQAVDAILDPATNKEVVYAGGHFGPTFAGATRHQLAALDAERGTLLPYTVAFAGSDSPGIWALDAAADGLAIGGGFTLAGNPARRYALLPAA
jgi:hypothetical protein